MSNGFNHYKLDDFLLMDGSKIVVGMDEVKNEYATYPITEIKVRYKEDSKIWVFNGIKWDGSNWIQNIESLNDYDFVKKHKEFVESGTKETLLEYSTFIEDDDVVIQQVGLFNGEEQIVTIDYTESSSEDDPFLVFIFEACRFGEFNVLRKDIE